MGASLRRAIDKLPEGANKRGLIRYLQVISPESYRRDGDVAMANAGIRGYLEKQFSENDCFAETAFKFYREIRSADREGERPHLSDKAGDGRFKHKPAGWLWEKALSFSGRNPNKAMMLIGLCGHDDINQGDFRNQRVEDKLLARGWSDDDLFIWDELTDGNHLCPLKTSDFYLPQSLGRGVDISSSLIERIARLQAEGRGDLLPAKHYHVLGAAFLTCQMIEAGMNSTLASRLQVLAARAYRGIRLCEKTHDEYEMFKALLQQPELKNRGRLSLDQAIRLELEKSLLDEKCRSGKLRNWSCDLLRERFSYSMTTQLSRAAYDRMKFRIQQDVEQIITSGLYGSWYLGGNRILKSLPCTDEQILGPAPLLAKFVGSVDLNMNICGYGLSSDMCKRALHIIDTWKVDFTWTVSQHKVGADFASIQCRRYEASRNSISSFCSEN